MVFNISSPPPVLFGAGASEQTGVKVKELGCKKVLCVHGKVIKQTGIADKIIANLTGAGIEVVPFAEVEPDPPEEIITRGAALAQEEQIDGIVGIGGGSALDTAKGINVLLGNPPPITRYYDKSIELKPGKVLVLLPTTAGTGSEANAVSVVTDTKNNKKGGVIGASCVASLAIVDPQFTAGLSPRMTAITGMDTFAHGVESMTSALNNPYADILDEKVITLVTRYLPAAVKNGADMTARSNLSLASLIAGMAFNDTILHLGHAIAHTMGAIFHIPHGVACAVALPEVIEYMVDLFPEKVKFVGAALGLDLAGKSIAETGRVVAGGIREFARILGLPGMKELNIERRSLQKVAAAALDDDCAHFLPRETTPEEILKMLEHAYDL